MALVVFLFCLGLFVAIEPVNDAHTGTVEAIWGAQAALLGFAVAVAVFGLQLGRDAWRGRAITIAPRVESSVVQGVGLLCVTGAFLILQPKGNRESAIAAVLFLTTILWFIVLVAAFLEVKRLTGLQAHLEIRRSRVLRATTEAVGRSVETRVGARLLAAAVEAKGGSASPIVIGSVTPDGQVRYERSGTVIDVRLCAATMGWKRPVGMVTWN